MFVRDGIAPHYFLWFGVKRCCAGLENRLVTPDLVLKIKIVLHERRVESLTPHEFGLLSTCIFSLLPGYPGNKEKKRFKRVASACPQSVASLEAQTCARPWLASDVSRE